VRLIPPPYWEAPTLTSRTYVAGSDREVVVVDARPCARVRQGHTIEMASICGLVEGHNGPHWECSQELVRESGGAFAVVVRR
jgi:hypothetical protein